MAMNRNTESHFSQVPAIEIQRSKFDRSSQHKTTFNTGDLIPIYLDEVLPGDTFTLDQSSVVRMSTPIYPVMDNAFVDYYYFFVPNRLVWDHWKEFNGENRTTHWEQPTEYEIPQIKAPSGGWQKGTIADFMGLPTKVSNISVSALPFRAYALIFNEWFRDQNLQDPCMVNTDDTTETGTNGTNYIQDVQLGGFPAKADKVHDYFTSCLPEPQKGPEVAIPIGNTAVVKTTENEWNVTGWSNLIMKTEENTHLSDEFLMGVTNDTSGTGSVPGGVITIARPEVVNGGDHKLIPSNLIADLSTATSATINQLRQAFAIQRLYERDARGGTRYTEVIRAHFGVVSPDGRQQRPEYLGGNRVPIQVDQVLQTSSTNETSPQGNTAAYSLTNDVESMFTHSFTEHGWIIGLAVVRTVHSYQQGINRMWSRKSRFDFYWPALANIGEQAVLNKEIYAQGTSEDEEAFGYQEAWADYRYKPSIVTGAMRSNYDQSLDVWHYADYYENLPTLSADWIAETRANVNRTIAVQDQLEDQFIADFYFKCAVARPMPVYSVPGLLDHN